MSLPIPAAPLFANNALWAKAANNLLDRAEGLLRDELAWRRARPCLMAEYYRLAVIEGARGMRPIRRALRNKWKWRCKADHLDATKLCPFAAEED